MKKDRNTFFSNYNAQTQSYFPAPNNFGPYTQASMNSNYYSGPEIATNNELENRLSKIERQINRLDNRLSKLENNITSLPQDTTNNYSNMYML